MLCVLAAWSVNRNKQERKEKKSKEKFTLFSDHNLLRRQPGAQKQAIVQKQPSTMPAQSKVGLKPLYVYWQK